MYMKLYGRLVITFNIYVYSLEKSVILKIAAADYIGKLAADGNIKLFIKGTVAETEQRFATQDVVEMRKPSMTVTVRAPFPHRNDGVTGLNPLRFSKERCYYGDMTSKSPPVTSPPEL